MYTDYKFVVQSLLECKLYPVLLDHVILDIHYKLLPSVGGERYSLRDHDPQVLYDRLNEPDKIMYMYEEGKHLFVNSSPTDLYTLPVNLFKVRIDAGVVNDALGTNRSTLEEEIMEFVACLNSDVPRARQMIGMSFAESTRFVPVRIAARTCKYREVELPARCNPQECFGPREEALDPRAVLGRLGVCASLETIVSCRDGRALRVRDLPEEIRSYDPYCLHWLPKHQTCVPLAFNPLENPVLTDF